jgi:hypothetical protein
MREFRISKKYYISELSVVLFDIALIIVFNSVLLTIILASLILIVLCSIINKLSTRYKLDDSKLTKKTLFKEEVLMHWDEVNVIANLAYRKNSVGVYTNSKKFIINSMIENYKQMIEIVIEKCKSNNDIKIANDILI